MGLITRACQVFLTAMFLMAGSTKITPAAVGEEMRNEIIEKVSAMFDKMLGIGTEEMVMALGVIEVFNVLLLWVAPRLGSLLFAVIMCGAMCGHFIIEDPITEQVVPLFLLISSILVFLSSQSSAKSKKD
eukprot:m.355776 g.355776  ORF g.355776 m.355776 type:complete len:130 (-) comp17335_c0_seq1:293-682(-)